jgi:hypothetical protein
MVLKSILLFWKQKTVSKTGCQTGSNSLYMGDDTLTTPPNFHTISTHMCVGSMHVDPTYM